MRSHYETLGIPQASKPDQIKRSYRALVKQYHPDLFPSGSEAQADAQARLMLVNAAYSVLSNPHKRSAYDAKLSQRSAPYEEPKPDYCEKCGRPTLYWQVAGNAARCSECGRRVT